MKKVEVVAAIIKFEKYILCVQRPCSDLMYISKKFEFPGGKIESTESRKQALQRELKEELSIDVAIKEYFMTVTHNYPDFELTMHTFFVDLGSKDITLNEHICQKWLLPEKLLELDWAAADLPIVHKLMDNE